MEGTGGDTASTCSLSACAGLLPDRYTALSPSRFQVAQHAGSLHTAFESRHILTNKEIALRSPVGNPPEEFLDCKQEDLTTTREKHYDSVFSSFFD